MENDTGPPGGLKCEERRQRPAACSYDSVTVFQSAPLVYRSEDGKYHAMLSPDFEEERRQLLEAVREAEKIDHKIDVFFEPANTDRLATFLASGQSPVVHFSAHGHPAYLLMEAEGQSQPLFVDRLRSFIAAAVSKPKLAFVSACHSQPAGDAFLAAGIEHVVCCQKKEKIRDTAAIVFAQSFYKTLALDKAVLKEAFVLAKQAVLNSPLVADAEKEAKKFLLLPEKDEGDDYHHVRIFYQSPAMSASKQPQRKAKFPPPPAVFLGRELAVFNALQDLKRSRLVQITGAKGIGKSSFAKVLCDYLSSRCSIFEDIFWLSQWQDEDKGELSVALRSVYKTICLGDIPAETFDEHQRTAVNMLRDSRVLVTIDVRDVKEQSLREGLESFLRLLFDGTRHIKVVLISSRQHFFQSIRGYNCACIDLPPLGFKSAALLFASGSRHVTKGHCSQLCSPNQFADLLVPENEEDATLEDESISKHSFEILKLIGCGIPGNTHAVASSMTEKEYDKLVWMAEQRTRDPISTIMRICPQTTLQEHISNLSVSATSPEPNQSQSVENGSSILLSGLSKGTGQLPAATPATDDEHTSSSDGSEGFVGVEFSGTNMDENLEWNDRIIASKQQIEQNLKKLLRYGNLGFGDTELKVEHLQRNGMEKAVVRLECEIELHEDLKRKEYGRVRAICQKLADLLRKAGATESELDKLMIGCAWRGSLELFLEGPSSCLSLLATESFRAESKLDIGPGVAHLINAAPAFLVQSPHRLFASYKEGFGKPDLLVWKQESTGTRLLCPTSFCGSKLLFDWGLGGSLLELEDVLYAKELTEGEYSFLGMTNSFAKGVLDARAERRASGAQSYSSGTLALETPSISNPVDNVGRSEKSRTIQRVHPSTKGDGVDGIDGATDASKGPPSEEIVARLKISSGAEETPLPFVKDSQSSRLRLTLSAKHLANLTGGLLGGKSDPFFVVAVRGDDRNGLPIIVGESEVAFNNLSPSWTTVVFLDGYRFGVPFYVEIGVFDFEARAVGKNEGDPKKVASVEGTKLVRSDSTRKQLRKGELPHAVMGTALFEVGQIMASRGMVVSKALQTGGKLYVRLERSPPSVAPGNDNGTILEVVAPPMPFPLQDPGSSVLRPQFVEYLSGGCQISLAVAIDYTASNGDPRLPGSPHYFGSSDSAGWNDYQTALSMVGSILAQYDADQRFPVWGFGAKYDGDVRHCFQCGNDVEVEGVPGLMEAYKGVFSMPLTMSYPTDYTEVIATASAYAMSKSEEAGNEGLLSYTILLILTAGNVEKKDAQRIKRELVEASDSPLSVVIVGIGSSDFSDVEFLADHDHTGGGRAITKFLCFKDYDSYNKLSEEVLGEIPDQLVEYYYQRGVMPGEAETIELDDVPVAEPDDDERTYTFLD